MKDLKIYSVDEVQEPLILKLFHNESGVNLIAVDLDGCPILAGSLLSITSNGFLRLSDHISKELELPLDEDGRLKIAGRKDKTAVTFSDDDGRLKIAGRKDKTAVTFSDDDSKVIAKMRSRLQIERHRTTDQDVYTDLRLYISVIEKMVEALGLPLANT